MCVYVWSKWMNSCDEPNFNPINFQMLKMKKHEELETPTFTTSIPIDIVE